MFRPGAGANSNKLRSKYVTLLGCLFHDIAFRFGFAHPSAIDRMSANGFRSDGGHCLTNFINFCYDFFHVFFVFSVQFFKAGIRQPVLLFLSLFLQNIPEIRNFLFIFPCESGDGIDAYNHRQ